MDPWFENFKILLTYWLMSTNRENVNLNMADTTASAPPSQHYGDHLQSHLPMPPLPPQGHTHMSHMGPTHPQTSLPPRGTVPYSVPPPTPLNTPMPQPAQSTTCLSPVHRDLPQHSSIPETTSTSQSQAVSSTCDSQPQILHSPQNGLHSPQQNLPESTTNPPIDRNHLCPTCSKGFKSKQQLAQHSLVHSGIRKYICSYCDKGFKQLCHLQQHTRIHTGEKPYKCSFDGCDRAFAQMANLHHHMRNHDDHLKKAATKQYHCMICHRAYTNESSLKSHTLKMHVHIKPLEQRITGLPTKPRKPRQPKPKDSSSPVMAIDLTCDDGSDNKVDIFSRVQALQNEDFNRVNAFQRADSFPRSDSLHRDDFRRADNLQRADSFPRSDSLQRDSFQRNDNLSRDLTRGESLQRESLHRSESLQRLAGLDSATHLQSESRQQQTNLGMSASSPASRVIPNIPRCLTMSERLTDTPANNKNLTASDLIRSETSSVSRSDLQQNIPAHSAIDPVSYYRPSPYNIAPHISHAHQNLHLPMRIPTSLPPFSQMGGSLDSAVNVSNASVFSSLQDMISAQHTHSSTNHMSVNSPTASSPQRLTN